MKIKKRHALLLMALLPCGATGAFAQIDITDFAGATVSTQYGDSPVNESITKLVDNTPHTKFFSPHNSA